MRQPKKKTHATLPSKARSPTVMILAFINGRDKIALLKRNSRKYTEILN
jgi:hypothetical protein